MITHTVALLTVKRRDLGCATILMVTEETRHYRGGGDGSGLCSADHRAPKDLRRLHPAHRLRCRTLRSHVWRDAAASERRWSWRLRSARLEGDCGGKRSGGQPWLPPPAPGGDAPARPSPRGEAPGCCRCPALLPPFAFRRRHLGTTAGSGQRTTPLCAAQFQGYLSIEGMVIEADPQQK